MQFYNYVAVSVLTMVTTYLLIWRSSKVALNRSIILKYMYEIVMTATSNCTYYHKVQDLILHNREFRSFGNRKIFLNPLR
jgi:hypothetical protein